MERIAIIGLGYIGTSIGLSIRAREGRDFEVVGYDVVSQVQNESLKRGAVNRTEWGLPSAVGDADLIVLAIPGGAERELVEELANHVKPGAVITDTTTAQRSPTQWARELLPEKVGFVGGNPLVSGNGRADASPTAFEGAHWALSPAPYAPESAVRAVVKTVEGLGAKPMFMDAEEHDSYVAAVSHMPQLLASALMLSVARSASWREMSRFAGNDFSAQTQLANINPEGSAGGIASNADMVVHWVEQVMVELADFRSMLLEESKDDPDGPFAGTMNDAWEARLRYENGITPGETPRPQIPSAGDMMLGLLMGEKVAERLRSAGRGSGESARFRGRG